MPNDPATPITDTAPFREVSARDIARALEDDNRETMGAMRLVAAMFIIMALTMLTGLVFVFRGCELNTKHGGTERVGYEHAERD